MLQFTDRQNGTSVWVNPHQVAAVTHLKEEVGEGCLLLLAGGFELHLRESAAEVSKEVQRRLAAY